MKDWTDRPARLAEELVAAGKLHTPEWIAAVRAISRHALVPVIYDQDPDTGEWLTHDASDPAWQERIYANRGLFTKIGEGTGTGYNAALLAHRLGAEHVFSVDIDRDLVDLARDRLARIGYRPTLVVADGAERLLTVPDEIGYGHAVEDAHHLWHELGQPGWDRFGLTATTKQQWIWLDSPDGGHTWPLTRRS
ncbi:MAG: methyltransferase domain-containing protein [Pseudonocardiaceae bacterium]